MCFGSDALATRMRIGFASLLMISVRYPSQKASQTFRPTTNVAHHQARCTHDWRECSIPLRCPHSVCSTPSAYRRLTLLALACRANQSVLQAHDRSGDSGRCPCRRRALATLAVARHPGAARLWRDSASSIPFLQRGCETTSARVGTTQASKEGSQLWPGGTAYS